MKTREEACLHDSGCDGRSHSLFCNDAWFYPRGTAADHDKRDDGGEGK